VLKPDPPPGRAWVRVKNAFMHALFTGQCGTQIVDKIGVSHRPLPTKTSRLVIQLTGRSWNLWRTCLHVLYALLSSSMFCFLWFSSRWFGCSLVWVSFVDHVGWSRGCTCWTFYLLGHLSRSGLAGQVTGLFPYGQGELACVGLLCRMVVFILKGILLITFMVMFIWVGIPYSCVSMFKGPVWMLCVGKPPMVTVPSSSIVLHKASFWTLDGFWCWWGFSSLGNTVVAGGGMYQFRGTAVDWRCSVISWGVMAFEGRLT